MVLIYQPAAPHPEWSCQKCGGTLSEDVVGHPLGKEETLSHLIHESCLVKQILATKKAACSICKGSISHLPHFQVEEIRPTSVIQHDRIRSKEIIRRLKEIGLSHLNSQDFIESVYDAMAIPVQLTAMRLQETLDPEFEKIEKEISKLSNYGAIQKELKKSTELILQIETLFTEKLKTLGDQSVAYSQFKNPEDPLYCGPASSDLNRDFSLADPSSSPFVDVDLTSSASPVNGFNQSPPNTQLATSLIARSQPLSIKRITALRTIACIAALAFICYESFK